MSQRGGNWVKQGKTLTHKHFEENLLALEEKNPDLRLDSNQDRFNWDKHAQRYTNLVTQALFLGYSLAINTNRTFATGHFIIAKADNERSNKPSFSEQPFVHSHYKSARSEMYRLARRHRGTKFILYNSITIQAPFSPVVRSIPEGVACTNALDDNGFTIYVGDTVHHSVHKVTGIVVPTEHPEQFAVESHADGEKYGVKMPLGDGRKWKIVSLTDEETDSESALDERFCLSEDLNDEKTSS